MIHVLDEVLVNKIAAGEVVERPMNVVKELVENAVDAGATRIVVEVTHNFLTVIDNGKGMDRVDLEHAILRHATSKIRSFDDLATVQTMGFRGEALSSIAAVSDLTITTKQQGSVEGSSLRIEGGVVRFLKGVGCSEGTVVEVRDLFFNTPVRKKFMDHKEFERIVAFLERFVLGNLVALKLAVHGKVVLDVQGSDLKERIAQVYGMDVVQHLIQVSSDGGVKVEGYVSTPAYLRRDRGQQSVFVNGRLVESEEVRKGLYDAYKSLLFVNKHPLAVLLLSLKGVDVNVHPAKKVVKFSHPEKVYGTVFSAIRETFKESPVEFAQEQFAMKAHVPQAPTMMEKRFQQDTQVGLKVELDVEGKKEEGYRHFPPLRLLGNFAKTFFLAESPEGMYIIDQHVVEERINYEKFMAQHMNASVEVQQLLQPELVEFTAQERMKVKRSLEALKQFGFSLEHFGEGTYRLVSVPMLFNKVQGVTMLKELLTDFKELEKEKIVTRMACRNAIKAGDAVSHDLMYALLKKLDTCELPFTCPHGRPTMVKLSLEDMEKMFRRKGF